MKTNPALYTVRIVSKIDLIQVIDVSKRSLALYLCPGPRMSYSVRGCLAQSLKAD